MANIKNFGIAGVGSDIQFGKGGARIIQAGNAFQVKKADNSALTNIQVANPLVAADATTKEYVDTANAAVTAALVAETAARVADVDAEESRAITAETALQNAIDAEISAREANATSLAAQIATEIADRIAADQALAADLAALGSAFNYVGSLTGGVDAAGATDLEILTQKDAGDYYKVSAAGYFKIGTGDAFYASSNDGLVWNLTGGVDIIDNTNSVVSGTSQYVTVTGSTDTGFIVDVASEFKGRVSTLETGLASEIDNRIAAIAAEANARTAADTLLTTNLAQEVSDRIAADAAEATARDDAILVEKTRAEAAEALLQTAINTEITDRQTAISNEAATRSAADTVLTDALAKEVSDRTNAVTLLQSNIDAEALARSTKDGELQSELDATQAGAGLTTAGEYIIKEGSNYLANATSLADADDKLDTALKAEVDARVAASNAASGALDAEIARATAAEGVLTADLAAEIVRATAAEDSLAADLVIEANARTAADTLLTTNLAAEVTRATDAENALQLELDATQTGAGLNADGSYTANATGNYVSGATSLKDADNLLDAALKAEVNRALAAEASLTATVNALGSAFNYVGLVEGGTEETPFDLDTLAADGKNVGDYYKVSVAGYFVVGEGSAFHANMNDGLVWNTVSSVDVIDNTNSTVSGTADFITVSGTTEFGYTVDVAETFKSRITTLEGGLADEITRATTAENAIAADLVIEANARTAADTLLTTNLDAEIARATAAEGVLTADLAAEIIRATAAEGVLTSDLATEVARATAAEGVLTSDLATEVATRIANVTTLTTNLTAEVTRATGVEASLQNELDATQTGAGLATDGSYVADAGSNYASAATSLADADKKIDAALKALSDTVAAGTTDLQSELDATQAAAGLATDGSYIVNPNAVYISTATTLVDADNLLDAALKAEEDARILADGTLQSNITAEANARTAADTLLTTNLAAEVARATAAEGVLTADLAAEIARATAAESANTTAIGEESTRAQGVEANLSAAIDAETARALAAEADLANTISALGSAFNYVGTVTGGADAGSAFDMTTKDANQKNAGDYFKVSTAGYFFDGTNTFFANINDGLVWNLDGELDKIDNTNSNVQGTLDFIAVSGSSDTGFTVDVDVTFKGRVSTLETGLADEITARTSADTTLQDNIDAEALARSAADTVLTDNLATEVSARTAADTALQSELDATQTGAGLGADGSYAANSNAVYISTATSLVDADNKLDAALKQVADDLANLSQDEIVSLDGNTSVKSANTGIEFSADVDGSKTKVGEIVAGANTNTTFQFDLGVADEVRIEVAGASDDVDIRLVPQGAGQVLIGDVGDGTIQAEDGYNLYVAGGDNTAGDGGNLILRGGDGSATDGVVEVRDGANKTVAKFVSGTANATSYTNFLNGTTSVNLVADGSEDNIDIVLDPKGTGSVDVSDTRVVNVAAPTDAHDAANKEYVDTSLAGGYVKTAVVNLTEATGVVSLGEIKGTVLRVKVYVTSAFSSGASITVGTASSTAELAPSSNVDETSAGLYLIETMNVYGSATEIVADVTAGSGSAGVAKVVVEYLTA